MSIRLIVPWVDNDNVFRLRNRNALVEHLRAMNLFEVGPIIIADSVAEARNVGAWNVFEDVFVFNDADTICPGDQIRKAVRLAGESPGLVFAYDLYVRLTEDESEHACEAGLDLDNWSTLGVEATFTNSGSMGCVAISRESFEQVGGFDEAYTGWGYEDLEFVGRCEKLWPLRRVGGPVFHLWHGGRRLDDSPLDSDEAEVKANFIRWCRPTAA